MNTGRPKYLNLVKIKLPLPGFVSILHRLSGAFLFLILPFLLYLLQASLGTVESFLEFQNIVNHAAVKVVLLGIAWAFLHHFFAGLRYLALDIHVGVELVHARASSWAVLFISFVTTAMVGVGLW